MLRTVKGQVEEEIVVIERSQTQAGAEWDLAQTGLWTDVTCSSRTQAPMQLNKDASVSLMEHTFVGELGKNYSGTGLDPNVIGRQRVETMPDLPRPIITRLAGMCFTNSRRCWPRRSSHSQPVMPMCQSWSR